LDRPGVIGPDRDMLPEQLPRFCPAETPDGEFLPVPFQGPVDGRLADGEGLFPDGDRDVKRLPLDEKPHLFPHERGQQLLVPIAEKGTDDA